MPRTSRHRRVVEHHKPTARGESALLQVIRRRQSRLPGPDDGDLGLDRNSGRGRLRLSRWRLCYFPDTQSNCGLYPSTRFAFSIEISDSFGWSGRLRGVPGHISSNNSSLPRRISELLLAMPNTCAPLSLASSDSRIACAASRASMYVQRLKCRVFALA